MQAERLQPIISNEVLTHQEGFVMATNELKSGETAKISGQYEIVNPNGKGTGVERTVTKGEPLPPTPQKGQTYRLVDKTKH
jgi:hypothetical protein